MLELMTEIGNSKGAIPFYAIYGPGLDVDPVTGDGFITKSWVYRSLKEAKAKLGEAFSNVTLNVKEQKESVDF